MDARKVLKTAVIGLSAGAAAAATAYAAVVVVNRTRYGKVKHPAGSGDSLLDRFLPDPEVVEQHEIAIDAPADVVIATAKEMKLLESPVIRTIFRVRELVLGGEADTRAHPSGLLDQMLSIGWVVLAERAGREVVLGAVTKPWVANPVFRSVPADAFAAFDEPDYVKIAWTLRADPVDANRSLFRTETRVSTTDARARARFRNYWSFVAPGIKVIRLAMLPALKCQAETRIRAAA